MPLSRGGEANPTQQVGIGIGTPKQDGVVLESDLAPDRPTCLDGSEADTEGRVVVVWTGSCSGGHQKVQTEKYNPKYKGDTWAVPPVDPASLSGPAFWSEDTNSSPATGNSGVLRTVLSIAWASYEMRRLGYGGI